VLQSEPYLPLALHYSFPREQDAEPFPRPSNTINYHRMQKSQYASTQRRYFPQRNDICVKYCYALRKVYGTERTEQGRTTYYRIYWRTYKISDRSPMWIQSKPDSGEDSSSGL
jgi:hypothetical protein